jgi:single-strand DNA-binding protein
MSKITVEFAGNLVADPTELTSKQGKPFAKLRVAVNEWKVDRTTGEFSPGPSTFLDVLAFDRLAENCLITLQKGAPVRVRGTLKVTEWKTDDGQQSRTNLEVFAGSVGVDLFRARGTIERTSSGSNVSATGSDQDAWENPPGVDALEYAGAADQMEPAPA